MQWPRRLLVLLALSALSGCGSSGETASPADAAPDLAAEVGDADAEGEVDPWEGCPRYEWTSGKNVGDFDHFRFPPEGTEDTTATELPDGRILLGNGLGYYDVATDTYDMRSVPENYRVAFSATVLADGHSVLIAGGGFEWTSGSRLTEIYDTATNTRREVGAMLSERASQAVTLLPDGRVIVFGGRDSAGFAAKPFAEAFDPATERWTAVPAPEQVEVHGEVVAIASLGPNEIFGGPALSGLFWRFQPSDGAFRLVPRGRSIFMTSLTALPGGRAMVTAGYQDDAGTGALSTYVSMTADWQGETTQNIPLLTGLPHFSHVHRLPCGKVVAFGWQYDTQTEVGSLYDIARNRWFPIDVPVRLDRHSRSIALQDGSVLVTYGYLGDEPLGRRYPIRFGPAR